ncbi:DUF6517 family protein [Halopelagius longus]|uniref:Uncharacterized protein n=1 Tax=Halopelagius longus TaxID=1236180 RepID=A0A1H1EXX0_9EURY|nr:DUF6517 family protein [Halopelagius longus]RDI71932.1 hypothetical protein DWB78_09465 [Halopelagius longus]SDQ93389.1 hypothetical protein SAMN05216278_3111 [Halopelagius longus]
MSRQRLPTTRGITRRTVLGGVAAGLAATSGCLGFATGSQPLAFEADHASVGDETLSETGYERAEKRSPSVSREFTVAGQTREVEVTNHLTLYEKAVDLGPLGSQKVALFALFTTPKIEIADRTFNPIDELSTQQLLERFLSRYEGLSVDGKVESATVRTLDTDVTVEKYEGAVTVQGQNVDVYLHVTRFEHGDDFVVGLGSYPQRLDGEAENVRSLIAGIEH